MVLCAFVCWLTSWPNQIISGVPTVEKHSVPNAAICASTNAGAVKQKVNVANQEI